MFFKRILWDAVMHSQTVSAKSKNKLIKMIPTYKTVLHMGLQDGLAIKPDELGSVPRTHRVVGENQLL